MATKDTDKEIQDTQNRIKPIVATPASAFKSRCTFCMPVIFIMLAACAGIFTFFSTPRGRIAGTVGFTNNIPIEHKYNWVAALN